MESIKMNNDITILLFAFNEEKRLRYFLDGVKDFSPIVVIDNFSEDNTVSIAREYTDAVYKFKNPGYVEHPDVLDFALSHVKTDWVFSARVDELIPATLLKKLDEVIKADSSDIVRISRFDLLFGKPCKSWGRDYQSACFKKSVLDYKRNALYELAFTESARQLVLPAKHELSLWHFSDYDVTSYTRTNNRYSSISAEMAIQRRQTSKKNYSHSLEPIKWIGKNLLGWFQSSRRLTPLRIIIDPQLRFIWHYFLRGGIRSGMVGFVTSYLMMMEQMLTELKIWELENGITKKKIDTYYDELKGVLATGKIPELKKDPFKEL